MGCHPSGTDERTEGYEALPQQSRWDRWALLKSPSPQGWESPSIKGLGCNESLNRRRLWASLSGILAIKCTWQKKHRIHADESEGGEEADREEGWTRAFSGVSMHLALWEAYSCPAFIICHSSESVFQLHNLLRFYEIKNKKQKTTFFSKFPSCLLLTVQLDVC